VCHIGIYQSHVLNLGAVTGKQMGTQNYGNRSDQVELGQTDGERVDDHVKK
jgi:hypothetical protein